MAFAEGVVDFVEDGRERAVALIAEIDAERIEAVAEHPRHAEQPDRAAVGLDAGRSQMALDLIAQRPAAAVAVIAVVESSRH